MLRRISRHSASAGRRWTSWRQRNGRMCRRPGRALATTAARAIFTPVQKRSRRQVDFHRTRRACAKLPGVGPYTANAIAAIAFDEKAAPVDGNIERVVSRLWAIGSDGTEAGWRAAKAQIASRARRSLFDALPDKQRAGDLAQALMDLGATVCTPKKPNCLICPLAKMCAARSRRRSGSLSGEGRRRRTGPTRYGSAFVLMRGDKVLLVRRPPQRPARRHDDAADQRVA